MAEHFPGSRGNAVLLPLVIKCCFSSKRNTIACQLIWPDAMVWELKVVDKQDAKAPRTAMKKHILVFIFSPNITLIHTCSHFLFYCLECEIWEKYELQTDIFLSSNNVTSGLIWLSISKDLHLLNHINHLKPQMQRTS